MYRFLQSNAVVGQFCRLAFAVILLLGVTSYGLGNAGTVSARMMSDEEAANLTGGMEWGACGIVAGIAIGVLALGVAGVSVGMASAAVISVGAHVAAAICIT